MSTLNRALSKIYGLDGSESCDAPRSGTSAERQDDESLANDSHDQATPAAHLRLEAENQTAGNATRVQEDFTDFAAAEVETQGDPSVTDSTELTGTILRMDGPSSTVTAPPHFDFADIAPAESHDVSQHDVSQHDDEAEDEPSAGVDDGLLQPSKTVASKTVASKTEDAEQATEAPVDSQELTDGRPLKPVVALHPEWEVDRFRWPETCQRLLLEKDEVLQSAVESLCQRETGGATIVGLVGEQPGDGVSTMALCIARCAAQQGRRVIVVDADITSPGLATILGLNTPCSWHDSIVGDAPLAESVVLSVEDQLCMMPLHVDCQQSTLSLTDERVEVLLRDASASNDLIVLDCGAIERLAERADMQDGRLPCDLAVVVRDASREKINDAEDVVSTLRRLRVAQVMLAENFVHLPKPSGDELKNAAA